MASVFKTLLACCLILPSLSNAETYSFGIVPQQSAGKLAALWVPILRQVSADSGHTLIFKTAKNIPEFEKKLAKGEYDFSYMNPYHYTVFHKSSNYNAILRLKIRKLRVLLLLKRTHHINNLRISTISKRNNGNISINHSTRVCASQKDINSNTADRATSCRKADSC